MDNALTGLEFQMSVTPKTSFQDDQHLNLLRNASKQCFYPFIAKDELTIHTKYTYNLVRKILYQIFDKFLHEVYPQYHQRNLREKNFS